MVMVVFTRDVVVTVVTSGLCSGSDCGAAVCGHNSSVELYCPCGGATCRGSDCNESRCTA